MAPLGLRSHLLPRFSSQCCRLSSAALLHPHTSDGGCPLPAPTATVSPSSSESDSDSALVSSLHHLIKNYFRDDPLDPCNLPPHFTIPSLTSAFSKLSPAPLSPSIVLRLIRSCAATRHGVPFAQTLSLFNWWVSSVPSSDGAALAEPFHAMVDFAGKARAFHVAWNLFDEMRDRDVPITCRTFFQIIRRYVRAGRPAEAAEAFARMEDYGCKPDPIAFSTVIAVLSKKRCAVDAQAFFDEMKNNFAPDVVVYTSLVHAWCRAYKIDMAEKVFLEMKEKGIAPNVYTYTIVIDALFRAGQTNRAHEVFVQMLEEGCSPNTATFNTLIRAHIKTGKIEKALQEYNQMKRMGCLPDLITYNFLIDAHCRQGNLDAALKVLNQMSLQGCSPDVHSFNPIIGCTMKLGDVNSAHKLYERMCDAKCEPNTVTYNTLMEMFGKSKSMDMVIKMMKEMDKKGVEPNVNTYNILVTLFCGVGNWNRAYKLLREMVEEKGLKPKGSMNQMVLQCLRKAGQLKKHEELVEKLVARGFLTRTA